MREKEKRTFPRLALSVLVEYSVLGHIDNVIFTTQSRNISASGIRVILCDKFNSGTLLGLKFLLPDSQRVISATGKIIWLEQLPIDKTTAIKSYDAGIEFVYIDDEDRKIIQQYIQQKRLR